MLSVTQSDKIKGILLEQVQGLHNLKLKIDSLGSLISDEKEAAYFLKSVTALERVLSQLKGGHLTVLLYTKFT